MSISLIKNKVIINDELHDSYVEQTYLGLLVFNLTRDTVIGNIQRLKDL